MNDRASDAYAVDDDHCWLIDAILITNQLADVRQLDSHPNDLQEVENLAFLLVPRQPELGANGPVAAVLGRTEVRAVDNQLVGRPRLQYAEALRAEFDAIHAHAADATPQELADILIDLLVKRHSKTRAFAALLDSRTDWTEARQQLRTQILADIKTALTTCAPDLDDREAEDVAAVVLSNMKTMWGMAKKDVPTTPGAPDQLRLMNRLYLAAVLRPGRLTAQ